MAELDREGDELVVRLRPAEKLEAVHGEVRVPRSAVTEVVVLDDAIDAVHGFRIGTGVPGAVAIGTFISRDNKTFAVVHHDTPRGVRVVLHGVEWDELIVGCDAPENVVARLQGRD